MFDLEMQQDFQSFNDWFENAPERGAESFPKVSNKRLYKDWLLQNPEGYPLTDLD